MVFKLYAYLTVSNLVPLDPGSNSARNKLQGRHRNKYLLSHSGSLFLFDTLNGNQANNNGVTYSFNFNRNFTLIPRVGLAVYTMDFEYSPVFSCQVTNATTTTSSTLWITTQNSRRSNQLYITYIATDHDYLGVFMPGPLSTSLVTQSPTCWRKELPD